MWWMSSPIFDGIASLEVVSSQVTEHSEKIATFSVVWLKRFKKEITLNDMVEGTRCIALNTFAAH
jgi:hypothetical protein